MPSVQRFLSTPLQPAHSLTDQPYDGVVIVSHSATELAHHKILEGLAPSIEEYLLINEGARSSSSVIAISKTLLPSGRLIYTGTGPVTRDQDDARRYLTAAQNGMKLALGAGVKRPMLITLPHHKYPNAEIVGALGALHQLHTPLNVREEEENCSKVLSLGLLGLGLSSEELVNLITGFEAAFTVCRDVGDSDPERMSPPRVAEYIQNAFEGSRIKVHVTSDQKEIQTQFPLMAAVNRAANQVEGHKARLIWLEYIPDGPVAKTIMLVGKGVTLDTGGADVKAGGAMFGMSRDKYGSAVVAGIFKALEIFAPKNVKVVGYMCMVRNSIGSHSYTCDEIIRCRSGKRIAIYNTDAEGRVTMLDPLTKMLEKAVNEKNPHLFTLATLTGHAVLSHGAMATAMDNGPAQLVRTAERLRENGDAFGQPVEISRLHSEDYAFHQAESESADLRQANTKPSVQTIRGHQTPAAFLIQGSRLDEHGCDSSHPIPFTHIDIGDAMGDYPHISYPNPLVAFIATFILPNKI